MKLDGENSIWYENWYTMQWLIKEAGGKTHYKFLEIYCELRRVFTHNSVIGQKWVLDEATLNLSYLLEDLIWRP